MLSEFDLLSPWWRRWLLLPRPRPLWVLWLPPPPPPPRSTLPNTLEATLSSWLRNMSRLSTLIHQLSELAITAPPERRRQLTRRAAALRADFKRQRERFLAFLRLSKRYADKFVSDVSEEIQQQTSFLDALEKRLDTAKSLREQADHLRLSYEIDTVQSMKKVRCTVLSQPLPEDVHLLTEMDIVLSDIQQSYMEMDKFWVDEVWKVLKALKNRRLDRGDIDRWRIFRACLEQSIAHWETGPPDNPVALHPNTLPSAHDLIHIVSSLSSSGRSAQRTLRSVRLSTSEELESVKPKHYSLILKSEIKFSENRRLCVEFFRECVRYGKNVVMICTAFVAYSPFSRSRNSQDIVDDATGLGAERIEVSDETAVQPRGMRTFNSVHKKCVSLLQRMDTELGTLFGCISVWITKLGAYSTFPALKMKELQRLSCIWMKNRDAIEHILTVLSPPDESNSFESLPPL